MAIDSEALVELGRSFHQQGTVSEKEILCLFEMVPQDDIRHTLVAACLVKNPQLPKLFNWWYFPDS